MAILSMTGFGEGQKTSGLITVGVEIRSVNHRFLDVNCKLPTVYSRFEGEIGRLLRGALKRGRVDVTVTRNEVGGEAFDAKFNEDLFQRYIEIAKRALKLAQISDREAGLVEILPNILFKREVLDVSGGTQPAIEEEWGLVQEATQTALRQLISMRGVEGDALEKELLQQIEVLSGFAKRIQEVSESTPAIFQDRLKQRLERLAPELEIDPGRLAQEVAILADRIDITEEMVRLRSHIEQFQKILRDGEGGRKLEFLLQEFGREINTTGSKSQHSEITNLVVESKATIEKLREQVLNIE